MEFNLPFEPTDWIDIGATKEEWVYITDKAVPGVEPNRYIISDFGRVFDLKRNIRCKERELGGYRWVNLNTDHGSVSCIIHRIVMLQFTERDPYRDRVNHMNGKKHCCLLQNLEWVTDSENINHALDTGLNKNVGEEAMLAKLSNNEVLDIMHQLERGVPIDQVIDSMPDCIQAPASIVNAILRGKAWKRLARDNGIVFAEYKDRSNRFSEDEKDKVGYMLSIGMTSDEILKELGYGDLEGDELTDYRHTISGIKCGRVALDVYEKYNLESLRGRSRISTNAVFKEDQLHQACKIFQDGFISYDDTLIKLGYDPSSMDKDTRFRYVNALSALRRKKNFPEITSLYNF